MVDPRMVWGKDEVWVGLIIVLGPGCCGGRMMSGWTLSWATDEVWVHEIMALAHGCSEGPMRSGWTLYGLPMDAREQAGNYQFLLRACFLKGPLSAKACFMIVTLTTMTWPHDKCGLIEGFYRVVESGSCWISF